jgi:uncharacterized membrane protein YdbT with pleckstrin-like domain
MEINSSQTKECPFCAETILAKAVKCRYCGEFLNNERAKALLARGGRREAQAEKNNEQDEQDNDYVLFAARPSLWAMAGAMLKGAVVLAAAVFLMIYRVEKVSLFKLSGSEQAMVGKYRFLFGLGIAVVVVLILLLKALRLKTTYYEVSGERIEYGRGLLDRQVDNLDMFRIIDMKLRRSFLDCIVGVGSVTLTTTDKSDPEFVFKKVRDARLLYDAIKKASLDADRKTNVVHLE